MIAFSSALDCISHRYGLLNWEDLHQFDEKYYGTLEISSILVFGGMTVVFYLFFGVDLLKSKLIAKLKPAATKRTTDIRSVRTASTSL